jgi:CHAD domain-containing protein
MSESGHSSFLVPHDLDVDRLARLLGGPARCRVEGDVVFELDFYDSFDWRLHQAGLRLLRVASGAEAVLRLKDDAGTELVEPVAYPDRPAWPAGLPDGPLKERVAAALEMRVLLPLVRVECRVTELALLDEEAKTVVRLQWLAMQCLNDAVKEPRRLWPRIRLLPVRGYEDALETLERELADGREWPRAPACLFDEVLAAVGREAGDYSSKLDIALQPGMPAVDAMRRILLSLLDTLERNVAGTRADLDSEFLHDLRVATRRTRSALGQVRHVLSDAVAADFRERFGWLGRVTGPTRDLDVFLLELPHYRASLPAAMADHLAPLESHLRELHAREQKRLRRELGSGRMVSLLRDWRAVLEQAEPPGEPGWFADLPVERVAASRIWKMYRKVRKAGRHAVRHGSAEDLHELRKDCKKLRYLIEFFRSLYPPDEIKGLVRALKDLLDDLGAFQDLQVQADSLRHFAAALDRADRGNLSAVLAIGALVADLLRRQAAARDAVAGLFEAFEAEENRARYRHLFKAKGAGLG